VRNDSTLRSGVQWHEQAEEYGCPSGKTLPLDIGIGVIRLD